MSAATLLNIGDFKVSPADVQRVVDSTSNKFSECGSRDPSTFCLNLPDDSNGLTSMKIEKGAIGGSSLLLSLAIVVSLILDRSQILRLAMRKCNGKERLRDIQLAFTPVKTQHSLMISRWSAQHGDTVIEAIYAAIWTYHIVLFGYFLNGLTYPSNGAKTTPVKVWTFGQIVGITVWAVPLFEFAKLLVEGVEKGLKYRTPSPYRITKQNDDEEH
ncbi:hypothetical protein ACLMJK_001276 [Lecanora helva]